LAIAANISDIVILWSRTIFNNNDHSLQVEFCIQECFWNILGETESSIVCVQGNITNEFILLEKVIKL